MARRVPPIFWRTSIRDHGLRDASLTATLLMLSTWMNRDGVAYPTQATIAKATGLSERTVRRVIKTANRAGWIALVAHGMPGQKWKNYEYHACVPDGVPLSDKAEAASDALKTMFGEILPSHLTGTLFPQRQRGTRPATVAGASSRGGVQGAAQSTGQWRPEDRPSTEEAPDSSDMKDRTRLPTNSSISNSFQEKSPEEALFLDDESYIEALSRPPDLAVPLTAEEQEVFREKSSAEEDGTAGQVAEANQPTSLQADASDADAVVAARARCMLVVRPALSPARLAEFLRLPPADLERALAKYPTG